MYFSPTFCRFPMTSHLYVSVHQQLAVAVHINIGVFHTLHFGREMPAENTRASTYPQPFGQVRTFLRVE